MLRCLRIPNTLHIYPRVFRQVRVPVAGMDPGTNTFQTLYDNSDRVTQFGYEKPSSLALFQERVAEYLVEEYCFVFLPKFHVKSAWNHTRFHDIMDTSHPGLIDIDEHLTSQICSSCGRRNKIRKRIYRCQCGLVMDRDANAAKNILQRGLAMLPLLTNENGCDEDETEAEDFDFDVFTYRH